MPKKLVKKSKNKQRQKQSKNRQKQRQRQKQNVVVNVDVNRKYNIGNKTNSSKNPPPPPNFPSTLRPNYPIYQNVPNVGLDSKINEHTRALRGEVEQMRAEMRRHNRGNESLSEKVTNKNSPTNDKEKTECKFCGKTFSDVEGHIRRVHLEKPTVSQLNENAIRLMQNRWRRNRELNETINTPEPSKPSENTDSRGRVQQLITKFSTPINK